MQHDLRHEIRRAGITKIKLNSQIVVAMGKDTLTGNLKITMNVELYID